MTEIFARPRLTNEGEIQSLSLMMNGFSLIMLKPFNSKISKAAE